MKNYNDVIKYLNLAYKNCGISNDTENLRILIKHTIAGFEKLIKKNKKIHISNKLENKNLKFPYPEQTLKLIESWIEEEKNEINDNK